MESTNPYRLLPAVEDVLQAPTLAPLAERVQRARLTERVREVLDALRSEIRSGELGSDELEARLAPDAVAAAVVSLEEGDAARGLVRAINATGVVLHTGLGRAPMHADVAAAMARAAQGYCLLEVDRASGERNRRDDRIGDLLARLTGAEAGIAVNNNAAATLLMLSTFAAGRETIVSRGELVEIGGSFRMPDVMERASTRLVEVGTTNRTRISDYARAVRADTGLLLKVHTSNFRVEGFTEDVGPAELAALGRERGVASGYDLGSGLLGEDLSAVAALREEPGVLEAVAGGIDVVTFSGDKLLGGPQAGLIVGRAEAIVAMRGNALYRALRLDKVTIAGLERTLELLLAGRGGDLPAREALARPLEAIEPVAEELARALAGEASLEVSTRGEVSQPGSGSAPGVGLPTRVVALRPRGTSPARLAARLRAGEPSVFVRVHGEEVLLDPRTLQPGEDAELVAAIRAALASS
jgi:L-seryl-tRNA(Ser) seleniumtransferase